MFQINYVKDAESIKHVHHLPADYPEFIRARECSKNASDVSGSVNYSYPGTD